MNRLLLILILTLTSHNAIAEWIEAGRSKDFTVYYDSATIRKSGSKVIIWSLHDYKTSRGRIEYRSATLESEYNCIKKQSRRLFLSFYQKNMGSGAAIHKDAVPHSWLPIAAGTIKESMWKIACRR